MFVYGHKRYQMRYTNEIWILKIYLKLASLILRRKNITHDGLLSVLKWIKIKIEYANL